MPRVQIYWRRRLSRLELALYAAVVGVLIAAFLDRVLTYMELAERTAMEATVNNVNSALAARRALQMLQAHPGEGARALRANPFELADMRVTNRHPDVVADAPLDGLERGRWVFQRSRNELIYLPQLHRGLQTGEPQSLVRFHLVATANAGYVLVPASPYSWE
jgi:hypothetical protein